MTTDEIKQLAKATAAETAQRVALECVRELAKKEVQTALHASHETETPYLNRRQVRKMLGGVSGSTLHRWENLGLIKSIAVGDPPRPRFRLCDVLRLQGEQPKGVTAAFYESEAGEKWAKDAKTHINIM